MTTFAKALAIERADQVARAEAEVRRRQQRWRGCYATEIILDALRRWAELHAGLAPRKADWTAARDPDHDWPRADKVSEVFGKLAEEDGRRWRVHERCAGCRCQDYPAGERTFTLEGGCPHGDTGYWDGVTGWEYAVELAGLPSRQPGDQAATASGLHAHGRNRQMVTAGTHSHPQVFQRRYVE